MCNTVVFSLHVHSLYSATSHPIRCCVTTQYIEVFTLSPCSLWELGRFFKNEMKQTQTIAGPCNAGEGRFYLPRNNSFIQDPKRTRIKSTCEFYPRELIALILDNPYLILFIILLIYLPQQFSTAGSLHFIKRIFFSSFFCNYFTIIKVPFCKCSSPKPKIHFIFLYHAL